MTTRRRTLLWVTLAVEGGLLAGAVILGLLLGQHFWSAAAWTWQAGALGVVSGLLLLAVAAGITESSIRLAKRIRRDMAQFSGIFREATLLDLLLISLLAGAGEEALFRGVLQPALAGYTGVPVAIIAVSILFGLVHPVSWAYVVFTAVLGSAFGILYAWSNNIVVPAAAHAAYDFAALLYGVRYGHFLRESRP